MRVLIIIAIIQQWCVDSDSLPPTRLQSKAKNDSDYRKFIATEAKTTMLLLI